MTRATAFVALAVVLAGCGGEADAEQSARTAMDALIAYARGPNEATWAKVPVARAVDLGLGDTLRARRSANALRDREAWTLSVDLFRGRGGTASALELIAGEDGPLDVTLGPHPHCASPPVPAPLEVADFQRVAVQPRDADGCLAWWTVDAFVDGDGEIHAVTFDVWEP